MKIFDKVVKVLRKVMNMSEDEEILLETSIRDDLAMDSLDRTLLIAELESEFNVQVEDKTFDDVDTVEEICEQINILLGESGGANE